MKRILTSLFALTLFYNMSLAQEVKKEVAPICAFCNMRIPDENIRFSVSDSKSLQKVMFDDIGCALLWRDQQCATMQDSFDSNAITHDYYTSEMVNVSDALYVIDSGVKTPMGYGILSFKTKENAERFVRESKKGRVISYQELLLIKLK